MKRIKESGEKGPKRTDRVLLVLLGFTCLSFMVWAVLGSLLALHFRERVKVAKIELADEREVVQGLRSDLDLERSSVREDMLNANMLRREVGLLFRGFLVEEERVEGMTDLLSHFQKVFSQLSGETLSRLNMITIRRVMRELSGGSGVAGAGSVLDGASVDEVLQRLLKYGLVEEAEGARVRAVLLGEEPKLVKVKAKPLLKPKAPWKLKPKAMAVAKGKPVVKAVVKKGWKVHVDKKGGYRLDLPETWSLRSDASLPGFMAVSPRTDIRQLYTAYVVLSVASGKNVDSLEAFYVRSMERVEEGLIDLERVEEKGLRLSGVEVKMLHLKHAKLGQPFHSMYYVMQHKGRSYMLSFTTPERNLASFGQVFDRVARSLRFD